VLGALAVLAIPAGAAAAQFLKQVRLVEAVAVAVPAALVLGLAAVSASRRARYRVERSVRRAGERTMRVGRLLAWAGVYFGLTGAIALAFYGALRWAG
jgi:hypothetical protein